MTLNINDYEEASKILTSSQSLGEQCFPSLIAQEDVQDLYRVECKVLNIFDDHDSEKDRNKIEEATELAMDKLYPSSHPPSASGTLKRKGNTLASEEEIIFNRRKTEAYGASASPALHSKRLPSSGPSTLRPSTSGTFQKKTRPSITQFDDKEDNTSDEGMSEGFDFDFGLKGDTSSEEESTSFAKSIKKQTGN